jgi:pilus assembly protein Flp/PilA
VTPILARGENKMRFSTLFVGMLGDESGATAIEYGLIAALIAVAAIAGMSAVGSGLQGLFTTVSSDL